MVPVFPASAHATFASPFRITPTINGSSTSCAWFLAPLNLSQGERHDGATRHGPGYRLLCRKKCRHRRSLPLLLGRRSPRSALQSAEYVQQLLVTRDGREIARA